MRKLYGIICALLLVCSFSVLVACGETGEKVSFVFEEEAYSINWEDESENNKLVIFAKTSNEEKVDYSLAYKKSDIKIESEYLGDGRYSFTIFANQRFSSTLVTFNVVGGNSSQVSISCVSALKQINLTSSAAVMYNNQNENSFDLKKYLINENTFVPSDTTQTNVEFSISDILQNGSSVKNNYQSSIYINQNNLVVAADLAGVLPLQIKVQATSKDREGIVSTPATIDLINSINQTDFSVNYVTGAINDNVNNVKDALKALSVSGGQIAGGFSLAVNYTNVMYNVDIDIVMEKGIFEVSSAEETRDSKGRLVKKVFSFVPSAKYNGNGSDKISFKVKHLDYNAEDFTILPIVSTVGGQTVYSEIEIESFVKISGIKMLYGGVAYDPKSAINVYTNTNPVEVIFTASPSYTSQKTFRFIASEDFFNNFVVSKSSNLSDTDKIVKPIKDGNNCYFEISSDEVVYLSLNQYASDGELFDIKVVSTYSDDVYSEYNFVTNVGASRVAFVTVGDEIEYMSNVVTYLENGNDENTNSKFMYVLSTPANFKKENLTLAAENLIIDKMPNEENIYVTIDNNGKLKQTTDEQAADAVIFKFKITATIGFDGATMLSATTTNNKYVATEVRCFTRVNDVKIGVNGNIQLISSLGDYSFDENAEVQYLAVKRNYSLELLYTTNQNATITKTEISYYDSVREEGFPYTESYKYFGKTDDGEFDLEQVFANNAENAKLDSAYIDARDLATSRVVTGIMSGKTIAKFDFYGRVIDENGQYTEKVVATKYVLIEVYVPITSFTVSDSNISLFSKEDLPYDKIDMAQKDIVVSLNSDATYNKIIFFNTEVTENNPYVSGNYSISWLGNNRYRITLLKKYIEEDGNAYLFGTTIQVYAKDLESDAANINAGDGNERFLYRQEIVLNAKEAIKVDSIELYNVPMQNGKYEIYLDLDKNTSFNIATSIRPENALNKNLEYIYQPATQNDQNIITIEDGLVRVASNKGGTGKLIIVPKDRIVVDSATGIKTIKYDVNSSGEMVLGDWYKEIYIVVADGLTRSTAYRISSLKDITNANGHYILLNSCDLTGGYVLDAEFNGGLYGRIADSDEYSIATIMTDHTLFDVLGERAIISEINISGRIANNYVIAGNAVVANVNNGTINKVSVINNVKNVQVGISTQTVSVPTTLKVSDGYSLAESTYAGGLVAVNNGKISGSLFAGSIEIAGTANNVGALVGILDASAEITDTYVHIYRLKTGYNSATEKYEVTEIKTKAETSANPIKVTKTLEQSVEIVVIAQNNNSQITNLDAYVIAYNDEIAKVEDTDLESLYITNTKNSLSSKLKKDYAVLLFYQTDGKYSLSETETAKLYEYNTINSSLLFADDSLDQAQLDALAKKLSIISSDMNLVSSNGTALQISGIGNVSLRISSKFDESMYRTVAAKIVNYAGDLKLTYSGFELENKATLYSRDKSNILLSSSTDGSVVLYNRLVGLKTEEYNVEITQKDGAKADYTGLTVGTHSVAVDFGEENLLEYNVSLNLYSDRIKTLKQNEAANAAEIETLEAFDSIVSNSFNKTLLVSKITGASKIDIISRSDVRVEPKDVVTISALLTTDVSDEVLEVKVYDQDKLVDYTNYFEFYNNIDAFEESNLVSGGNLTDGIRAFNIKLRLKDEYKHKSGKYVVEISVKSDLYDLNVYSDVDLTINPQNITNINATLYLTETVNSIIKLAEQTSVLSTSVLSNTGMLMVDLYPNYSDYDYLQITSSSATSSIPLSLRLYQKEETNFVPAKNDAYTFMQDGTGLVVFKQTNQNSANVGLYYIKVYVNANITQNSVYNINITPYKNNQALDISTNYTLYIKPQQKAGITFNGQDFIYATKGSEITADVMITSDQEILSTTITGIDDKALSGDVATILEFTEDTTRNVYGYKFYTLKLAINETSDNKPVKTQSFRVGITTKRTLNGIETTITSYAKVYVVDFLLDSEKTYVDSINGNVKYINNLISEELDLTFAGTGNSELIDEFNSEYYYYYNNEYILNYQEGLREEEYKNRGIYGFIKNLYYVNGESKSPIYNDVTKEFTPNENIEFTIKENKLYVLGKQTGSVNLQYYMPMVYPDGAVYYFTYDFTLTVRPYTDEDKPTVIANNSDFLNIFKNETADSYILMQDLYLYDFDPIENTDKIITLDGNNKTINIVSFSSSAMSETNVELALFKNISQGTTISNLTINIFELGTIKLTNPETSSVKIAPLAITNSGVVYNTEVVTYKSRSAVGFNGISLQVSSTKDVTTQISGFVLENSTSGSITNSRVGGTSRKVIEVIKGQNSTDVSFTTKVIDLNTFSISGFGEIAGFVGTNNGNISSCFVKNVKIENNSTQDSDDQNVTSGFVTENNGTILLSYAEGTRATADEIHISKYGISTSGIAAGFVYLNNNSIKDCYSNIKLSNNQEASGRFSAGFVYINAENATIQNAYSYSLIKNNSAMQTNFSGVDTWGNSLNYGKLTSCYYYSAENILNETEALEEFYNSSVVSLDSYNSEDAFYGFAFSGHGEPTWEMTLNGPSIISANKIAISVRYEHESNGQTVFLYANGYALGSEANPIIIRNAAEFNEVFGTSNRTPVQDNYNLSQKEVYGSYRLTNNIRLADLMASQGIGEQDKDLYSLTSTQMTLTGEKYDSKNGKGYALFDGNGFTISNFALSDTSLKSNTMNFGLFKEIKNGAMVKNLNITVGVERKTAESSETIISGVDAKNANFVGALAGTLQNASIVNVNVTSAIENTNASILGSNIVGGIVGRVIGDSTITSVSTSNLTVTASHYREYASQGNVSHYTQINKYVRSDSIRDNQTTSIAGGIVGVYDVYADVDIKNEFYDNVLEMTLPTALTLKVSGKSQVYGGTVGGVVGYVGQQSFVQDVLYEVPKLGNNKIVAYSGFAGGVIGYNRGYVRMARAEHEESYQNEIQENAGNYYKTDTDVIAAYDRGVMDIFADSNYKPLAVGGLVGLASYGKIEKSYSKINVVLADNQTQNIINHVGIGGVIGVVDGFDVQKDETRNTNLVLNEVYSFSDVYAAAAKNTQNKNIVNVGGIIGAYGISPSQSSSLNLKLTKVNAVNYWGRREAKADIFLNKLCLDTLETSYIGYFKFDNNIEVSIKNSANILGTAIENLKDYDGATTSGTKFDTIFKMNTWDVNTWQRDDDEMLPHLLFGFTRKYIEIKTTSDLYKLEQYGSSADVVFVIKGNNYSGIIDANGFTTVISNFRATLKGYDNKKEYGIKNLSNSLFANATNAQFDNFKLIDCAGPFIRNATNIIMTNIHVYGDNTYKTVDNSALVGILSGNVTNRNKFENINVQRINAQNSENNGNVSMLVSKTTIGTTATFASVSVQDSKFTLTSYETGDINTGALVADDAGSKITASNVKISGLEITANNEVTCLNANIGMMFGKTNTNIKLSNSYIVSSKVQTLVGGKTASTKVEATEALNFGGVVANQSIGSMSLCDVICEIQVDGAQFSATKMINFGFVAGFMNQVSIGSSDDNEQTTAGRLVVKNPTGSNTVTVKAEEEANVSTIFGQVANLSYTAGSSVISNANLTLDASTSQTLNFGGYIGKFSPSKTTEQNANVVMLNANVVMLSDVDITCANTTNNISGVFGNVVANADENGVLVNISNIYQGGNITLSGTVIATENKGIINVGGAFGTINAGTGSTLSNALLFGNIDLTGLKVDAISAGGIAGSSTNVNYKSVLSLVSMVNRSAEKIVTKTDNNAATINFDDYNVNALVGNYGENSSIEKDTTFYSHVVSLCSDPNKVDANITYGSLLSKVGEVNVASVLQTFKKSESQDGVAASQEKNFNDNLFSADDLDSYTAEGTKINPQKVEGANSLEDLELSGGELNKNNDLSNILFGEDSKSKKDETKDTSTAKYVLNSKENYYIYLSGNFYTTNSITLNGKINILSDGANVRVFNVSNKINVYSDLEESITCKDEVPFNSIDENCIVSGLVTCVYIDEPTSDSFSGGAPFANENKGIVYSCAAKELNIKYTKSLSFHSYGVVDDNTYSTKPKDNIDIFEGKISITNKTISGFIDKNTGLIAYSYAKVNVTARNGAGLVGDNSGTISNCYSTGSVTGTNKSGVYAFAKNTDSAYCINCFTISECSNKENNPFGKNAQNCWADKYVTSGGEKETDAVSLNYAQDNSPKHNFKGNTNVWDYNINYNYGYPFFDFGMTKITSDGNKQTRRFLDYIANYSTTGDYYQIPNFGRLTLIDTDLSGKYMLIKDIDATLEVEINNTSYNFKDTFEGILDGNCYSIKNLKLVNFFFEENVGTIKNVTFSNFEINVSAGLAGIVSSNSGTIQNVKTTNLSAENDADQSGDSSNSIASNISLLSKFSSSNPVVIGVLAAQNTGTIEDVQVEAGIVLGWSDDSNTNAKGIKVNNLTIGGVVGDNAGTITLAEFTGAISVNPSMQQATSRNSISAQDNLLRKVTVGGIAGINTSKISYSNITSATTLFASCSDAVSGYDEQGNRKTTESAVSYVGGIVGLNVVYTTEEGTSNLVKKDGTISQCYTQINTDNILTKQSANDNGKYEIVSGNEYLQTEAYAGGIAAYGGIIEDCFNEKNVAAIARWFRVDNAVETRVVKDGEEDSSHTFAYLMAEYEQKAHAGGISNGATYNNTIVNYGSVSGGYKGQKAFAQISSQENYGTETMNETRAWHMLAGGVMMLGKNKLKQVGVSLAVKGAGYAAKVGLLNAGKALAFKTVAAVGAKIAAGAAKCIPIVGWIITGIEVYETVNDLVGPVDTALFVNAVAGVGYEYGDNVEGGFNSYYFKTNQGLLQNHTYHATLAQVWNNNPTSGILEEDVVKAIRPDAKVFGADRMVGKVTYSIESLNNNAGRQFVAKDKNAKNIKNTLSKQYFDSIDSINEASNAYIASTNQTKTSLALAYKAVDEKEEFTFNKSKNNPNVIDNNTKLSETTWSESTTSKFSNSKYFALKSVKGKYSDLQSKGSKWYTIGSLGDIKNESNVCKFQTINDNGVERYRINVKSEADLKFVVDMINHSDNDIISGDVSGNNDTTKISEKLRDEFRNAYIYLCCDINMKGEPISLDVFNGTIDGAYRSVYNLKIDASGDDVENQGLIKLANNATLKNLYIALMSNVENEKTVKYNYGGLIAVASGSVKVENVSIETNQNLTTNSLNTFGSIVGMVNSGATLTIENSTILTNDSINQSTKHNLSSWNKIFDKDNSSAFSTLIAVNNGTVNINNSSLTFAGIVANTSIPNFASVVAINSGTLNIKDFKIDESNIVVGFNNNTRIVSEDKTETDSYNKLTVNVAGVSAINAGEMVFEGNVELFNNTEVCFSVNALEDSIICNFAPLCLSGTLVNKGNIDIGKNNAIANIGYGIQVGNITTMTNLFEQVIAFSTDKNKTTNNITNNMQINMFAKTTRGSAKFDSKVGYTSSEFGISTDGVKNKIFLSGGITDVSLNVYSTYAKSSSILEVDKSGNIQKRDYTYSANYFSTYKTIDRQRVSTENQLDGKEVGQNDYILHTQYVLIETSVVQMHDTKLQKFENPDKDNETPVYVGVFAGDDIYSVYIDTVYELNIYENSVNYDEFGFTYTFDMIKQMQYIQKAAYENGNIQVPKQIVLSSRKSSAENIYEPNVTGLLKFKITDYKALEESLKDKPVSSENNPVLSANSYLGIGASDGSDLNITIKNPVTISLGSNTQVTELFSRNQQELLATADGYIVQTDENGNDGKTVKTVQSFMVDYDNYIVKLVDNGIKVVCNARASVSYLEESTDNGKSVFNTKSETSKDVEIELISSTFATELKNSSFEDKMFVKEEVSGKVTGSGFLATVRGEEVTNYNVVDAKGDKIEGASKTNKKYVDDSGTEIGENYWKDHSFTIKSVTEKYSEDETFEGKSANWYVTTSRYTSGSKTYDIISYIKYAGQDGMYTIFYIEEHIFEGDYYLGRISYNALINGVNEGNALLESLKSCTRTAKFFPMGMAISNKAQNLGFYDISKAELPDLKIATKKTVNTYTIKLQENAIDVSGTFGTVKQGDISVESKSYKVTTTIGITYDKTKKAFIFDDTVGSKEIELSSGESTGLSINAILDQYTLSNVTITDGKTEGSKSISLTAESSENGYILKLNGTELTNAVENDKYYQQDKDLQLNITGENNEVVTTYFIIKKDVYTVHKIISSEGSISFEEKPYENVYYTIGW